jgi:hypothetical protein
MTFEVSARLMSAFTPIAVGPRSRVLLYSSPMLCEKASKSRVESSEEYVPRIEAPRVASSMQIARPIPFVAPL